MARQYSRNIQTIAIAKSFRSSMTYGQSVSAQNRFITSSLVRCRIATLPHSASMKKTLAALAFALCATPGIAQVPQFPQTLPPNTVVGRTGITAGPAQAIPMSVLAPSVLSGISGAFTCTAGGACTLAPMGAGSVKCNPSTTTTATPQDCGAVALIGNSTINAAGFGGAYLGPTTGAINWCPAWGGGCANGTAGGAWTSQLAIVSTTAGPPTQQESSLMSVVFANTGFFFMWSPTTSYASGNYAVNGANMYQETVASCTSAGSGGPTGTGTNIVDNTCRWNYAAPQFAGGKQAGNFNTIASAGGGHVWGLTAEAITQGGWNSQFAAGAEIDAGNSVNIGTQFGVGPATILNLYLGGVNQFPITAALLVSPQTSSGTAAAQYGIILTGSNAFSSAAIFGDAVGAAGASFITDVGTSVFGINLAGTYSNAAILVNNSITIQTGGINANLFMNVTGQSWLLDANAGSKLFTIFDSTNSKTPFSIQPNSATNTLNITTTGISVTGNVNANGNPGVSCSGTPTSSFASNNGVVTHC